MHTKKTSAQLKQAARGIMLGKYRNAISILLASDLIINTISVMSATSNESFAGIIIGLAISFILVLLGTILNVGQCSFYLNIACNQKYEFGMQAGKILRNIDNKKNNLIKKDISNRNMVKMIL